MEVFDVAIVGLGALGSAAAYHSAIRGAKVIGFEQFEFGHVHGASHDTSRIIRTSYGAPEYVKFAKAAYRDWAELEERTGLKLLTITGGLVFLVRNGPYRYSSEDFTRSLKQEGVPFELLSAAEVHERWPQITLDDNVDTIYTADSGIAHASKTVSAMQFLARSYGAILRENTRVDLVETQGSGTKLTTSNGQYLARKVILATDAWTNKLLKPLGAEIPLEVMQEQVTYYKPTDPEKFTTSNFPVWIWGGEYGFYGFPSFGEPTIKAGRDWSRNLMTPEQRTYVPSKKLFHQLTAWMDKYIPDDSRQALRTVTCQYAIPPGRRFVISPLENHPDIIVGLGAGHAFKFVPAFGRALAELALDGETTDDVSAFEIPKANPTASKL